MKAYVTLLSTDDYLEGVLVMARSLEATDPAYPLVVLISQGVSQQSKYILTDFGLSFLPVINHYQLPDTVGDRFATHRWAATFDKLETFHLLQFEKVLFVDSDMLISRNLDHLFEYEHMSCANYYGGVEPYDHFTFPNSGLFVAVPEKGLGDSIFSVWPKVAERLNSFSDQDLLHEYYGAKFSENKGSWRLPVTYNACSFLVDRIARKHGLNGQFSNPNDNTIAVVHFSSKKKPWKMSVQFALYLLARKALRGKWKEVQAYRIYFTHLLAVRKAVKHKLNRYLPPTKA